MRPRVAVHPDHAAEQAYIERVHRADEHARSRAEHSPDAMADKHAARSAREQMLERLSEPVDLDALCFGRIDLESERTHYLGRGAVYGEHGDLLVINWRRPIAAGFYTASQQDPCGVRRRRRFQLEQLRLLGIVEDTFGADPDAQAQGKAGKAARYFPPGSNSQCRARHRCTGQAVGMI